jgi:CHAT domain-containing protein
LHPWNEIAAAIDTQTAVIEYAVLDKRIVAWVGTHAELHYYALSLDPAELRPLAERLQNGSLNDRTAAYDLLLRPLRCRAAKRLIIVADGDLARIAFPLLYDREEGRYAIEEFELMLEPSLNYFTERRPAGKSFHSMFALTAVNGARLAGVPAEVASITRLFPRVETGMTAGDLLLRATNFDIIHFAGHADPNAAAPALMLLPDSARPDGRLYSTEIEAVHFAKAPLVVLSACGTSRGSTASEGTMSLARSFLAAGAGTVVATVWDVDDAVSAALMRRFYENISRGETVGSALRLAQTALLHDPTQGTSTDWSAFQVIGGT